MSMVYSNKTANKTQNWSAFRARTLLSRPFDWHYVFKGKSS